MSTTVTTTVRTTVSAKKSRTTRGTIHARATGEQGLLQNRELGLPYELQCTMAWIWGDAPAELDDIDMGMARDPQFVTVIPNKMRFTHMPENPQVIVECADVLIVIE